MSNNWHYTVIFYPQNGVADAVRSAVSCAELRGFTPVNTFSGRLTGMKYSGLEELSFDTLDEAVDFLANQGGLLEFWKNHTGIAMTFRPLTYSETNDEKKSPVSLDTKPQAMHDTGSLYEISVVVGDHLLRFDRDRDESIRTTGDVHSIFLGICNTVDALYGYSTDENLLEYFLNDMGQSIEEIRGHITEGVRTKSPPAFLFWLQYFSEEYSKMARLGELVDMGGQLSKLSKGFTLSFFNWPWEMLLSTRLQSTNRQWWRTFVS